MINILKAVYIYCNIILLSKNVFIITAITIAVLLSLVTNYDYHSTKFVKGITDLLSVHLYIFIMTCYPNIMIANAWTIIKIKINIK